MGNIEHLGQYDSGVSYKKAILWFIIAGIVISLGALYFALSRVTITIIPKTETKEVKMDVIIDSSVIEVDFENNKLRGVLLSEEGEMSKSYENLAPKQLEENATGKITIYNGYTRAQGFKAGDVLVSKDNPKQKIALKENTIVYRSKARTVEAYALEKGVVGHIPPGDFMFEKYDNFMNEKVTAKSTESFSGGVRTANLITEDDLTVAKNEVMEEIAKRNFDKIKLRLRDGEELNKDSAVNVITGFNSSVAAPIETDNFKIDVKVRTTAAVFKKADLVSLINNKLASQTGTNQEFLGYDPESLVFTVDNISLEEQKAIIKAKVAGRFRPKLSTKIFNKDDIKGYNERALRAHYSDFNDISEIKVDFWPSFRKTVPDMDNRIIIEIKD